MAEIEKCI